MARIGSGLGLQRLSKVTAGGPRGYVPERRKEGSKKARFGEKSVTHLFSFFLASSSSSSDDSSRSDISYVSSGLCSFGGSGA